MFEKEWILRDTKVCEQVLAIRDLVKHKAKEAIEEPAISKIGDTASADGSDKIVQVLDRIGIRNLQSQCSTNAYRHECYYYYTRQFI